MESQGRPGINIVKQLSDMDVHDVVLKLKKKLNDAVEQRREDDYLLKLLHRLSQVPMTLSILQSTQIGKDVNGLRKLSGTIKTESKALVQTWKKLLPPPKSTEDYTNHTDEYSTKSAQGTSHTGSSSNDCDTGWVSSQPVPDQIRSKSRKSSSKPRPKGSKTKDSDTGTSSSKKTQSLDDFSKALLGGPSSHDNKDNVNEFESEFPKVSKRTSYASSSSSHRETYNDGGGSHSRSELLEPRERSRTISPHPASSSSQGFISTNLGQVSSSSQESVGESSLQGNSRKRKADVCESLDVVALSKRSRTQVYSGKKTVSGPQFVIPLFDQCMKVLLDNIDAIEEVGGIPFYVLEPVLSKCTPTQLMRLEEYNPHFIEDSDGLWEKHVCKEFKGASATRGQTWRELYLDKLEHREMRLRNLTARISATEKARKEPMRKVMSTVATRKPGRRGARSVDFFPSRPGGRPLEKPSGAKSLMKQTMKMAKERNHMLRYKPSQR